MRRLPPRVPRLVFFFGFSSAGASPFALASEASATATTGSGSTVSGTTSSATAPSTWAAAAAGVFFFRPRPPRAPAARLLLRLLRGLVAVGAHSGCCVPVLLRGLGLLGRRDGLGRFAGAGARLRGRGGGLAGRLRLQAFDLRHLSLGQDDEAIQAERLLRLEGEALAGLLLQLVEELAGRAREDGGDVGVQLHEKRLRLRAADVLAELPLHLHGARLRGDDDPRRLARRTLVGEDLARPVGHVLARHLHQAERGDLDDVRLGPVARQLGVEGVLDELAVLRVRHVDEVDDDDPADVAQPELAHDLGDRLEVVLRDRVLEARVRRLATAADEAAGVHVDDGEGLGVVEDEVAARRKVDPARERRVDGLEHTELFEQRRLAGVELDACRKLGGRPLEVLDDLLVRALVVDDDPAEVPDEEVADDAQRKLSLLVDERRGLGAGSAAANGRPELQQVLQVAGELGLRGALCSGADDEASLGQLEALADRLQPLALVVLQAPRDPDPVAVGRVDEEAARERDLRRQARALRPHGILHGLDEDLLASGDQLLDALAVALALELGHHDLVHVQEAVAAEADVDERGLHAREDIVDDSLVDVARNRPVRGPTEVDLGDLPVLHDRDGLLEDLHRDEDLLLDVRERDSGRRRRLARRCALALTPRLVSSALLRDGRGLPRLRRPLGPRGGRRRLGLRGGRLGLLLAPATAAAPAAASGRLALGLSGVLPGRLLSFLRLGSGCLGRRLLLALLPSKPWHVGELLSGARRARRAGRARRAAGCLPQISCDFRAESRKPVPGWTGPCASPSA